jgi:hypothetical protein
MLAACRPEMLSDAELLATLLSAGKIEHPEATAKGLIEKFGSFAEANLQSGERAETRG